MGDRYFHSHSWNTRLGTSAANTACDGTLESVRHNTAIQRDRWDWLSTCTFSTVFFNPLNILSGKHEVHCTDESHEAWSRKLQRTVVRRWWLGTRPGPALAPCCPHVLSAPHRRAVRTARACSVFTLLPGMHFYPTMASLISISHQLYGIIFDTRKIQKIKTNSCKLWCGPRGRDMGIDRHFSRANAKNKTFMPEKEKSKSDFQSKFYHK